MAMGRNAIQSCRENVSYFNAKWENSDYTQILSKVQSDAEYQKFVSQTETGKVLNEKLTKMFELYGKLWVSLEGLGAKTRAFLDAQEALNNRENIGSGGGFSE